MLTPFLAQVPASADSAPMSTVLEAIVDGGPVMIPLGLCSVVALAWSLERLVRLRDGALGNRELEQRLLAAVREGGPARALEVSRARKTALGEVVEPILRRWSEGRAALEKAAEDAGSRVLRAQVASLRTLTVVAVIAPLLGLLGTVIGIILSFREIAHSNAIGRPEALSAGIAQALVTTAAGLVIAIPTQAMYFWLRARIDRFGRRVELFGEELLAVHDAPQRDEPPAPPRAGVESAPRPPEVLAPVSSAQPAVGFGA